LKACFVITLVVACLGVLEGSTSVMAQSNDSLIAIGGVITPGDTGYVSIFLRNTQFSVGGFSLRLVLLDSISITIVDVVRGQDDENFDYFGPRISQGSCRVLSVADMPNGGIPPPLAIGYHEIARIIIYAAPNVGLSLIDSLLFEDDTLPPDHDNSISDSTGYMNEVPVLEGGQILISSEQGGIHKDNNLPRGIELMQNYPNPFNSETRLEFNISVQGQNLSLEIYDSMGRQIRCYNWNNLSAGQHNVTWDGRNESGRLVASGIYLYRLTVQGLPSRALKMTFLK
jgi:hypothetical protein